MASLVRRDPDPDSEGAERFDALVHGLFQLRRKSLRAALASVLGSSDEALRRLEREGIDPLRRAETLDVAELERLASA